MSADPKPLSIVVDTREKERHGSAYTFAGIGPVEVVRETLPTGDYSLVGFTDQIAIERKTLDDLIGCLSQSRERFERELARSRPYEFFAVVVEGQIEQVMLGHYHSHMTPNSALQSILAFQVRYRLPLIWATNRGRAEEITYHLLRHYLEEIEKRYQAAAKAQPAKLLPIAKPKKVAKATPAKEVSHG